MTYLDDHPALQAPTAGGDTAAALAVGSVTQERRQFEQGLVERHLALARALAHRFSHRGEPSDDLEQVAMLALVKVARRYDRERGVEFATYATTSIVGELKRHFRDRAWMLHVPRSTQEMYLRVKQAREAVAHQFGEAPTVAQIAAYLAVSDEDVLEAMEAGSSYWPASLDMVTGDEDRPIQIPVLDDSFERVLNRQRLRDVLPQLDQREQFVLKLHFFDGWTQQRIAAEIGVSQMQVSRLLARTLAKLRSWFEES